MYTHIYLYKVAHSTIIKTKKRKYQALVRIWRNWDGRNIKWSRHCGKLAQKIKHRLFRDPRILVSWHLGCSATDEWMDKMESKHRRGYCSALERKEILTCHNMLCHPCSHHAEWNKHRRTNTGWVPFKEVPRTGDLETESRMVLARAAERGEWVVVWWIQFPLCKLKKF
jgi:hypothetical protein